MKVLKVFLGLDGEPNREPSALTTASDPRGSLLG